MDDHQSTTTTLRVVTMPTDQDAPVCEGTYVCACPTCEADRADAVSRGHRPRRPLPLKRAA